MSNRPLRRPPATAAATAPAPAPVRTQASLLVMVVVWAINFSVIKVGLEELSPLAFNALRFVLASVAVWAVLRLRGPIPVPRADDVWKVVGLGVLGNVVYQLFFIFGLDRTLAGNAALLLATSPILVALLSSAYGHERADPKVWAGVVGTVVGMAFVILGGGGGLTLSLDTLVGDLIMVGAAATWAVYTVGARGLIDRYGSVPVTAWTLWIGTIGLVLIGAANVSAIEWGSISPAAWAAVAYGGILGIALAYLLWYQGVRRIGNTRTAIYSNLVPVLALVVAWLWLGEVPGLWQIVGAVIIIAGITATQR